MQTYTREEKKENLIWILFTGIGMLFVLIGTIVCIRIFDYSDKIDTTGVITDISSYTDRDGDRNYEVYVSYDVNGKPYESRLNGYSTGYYEGKEIEIYYDREHPDRIGAKSLNYLLLIFPGIGLVFLIIGVIGLIIRIRGKKREQRLRENGKRIDADYVRTDINTKYALNGVHPYNIICRWENPSDGKTYIFKSKNIWADPQILIEENNIRNFPVYIDDDYKYLVDTGTLTDMLQT